MLEKGIGFVPDFYIPTPSHQLNNYLYKGGLPSGGISQIQGSGEGSFKTTFSLQLMANIQAGNVIWTNGVKPYEIECAYVDAEGSLDIEYNEDGVAYSPWLEKLGIDVSKIYIIPPQEGEKIFNTIRDLVENYNVKYIILDSIHATQPAVIHDSNAGDSSVMVHAKLHTTELVKLIPVLRNNQAHLVGINHLKANMTGMGVMGEKAGGGKAWRFYSRHVMITSKSNSKSKLEGSDNINIKLYLEKNKTGPSFKELSLHAEQGFGFNMDMELIEIALDTGTLKKAGSWIKTIDGETLGQGISHDNVINWCRENKDVILSKLN